MSLYDPNAYNAHLMPHHERVLVDAFDNDLGSVGLFFDRDNVPIAAWYLETITDEEARVYSTASIQDYPWIPDNPRSPLTWIYREDDGQDFPEWEGSGFTAYEVCPDGLKDLSTGTDGSHRSGKEIATAMAAAPEGRFFLVHRPGHGDFALVTRSPDGTWFGNACGPEFTYDREYPHPDAVDLLGLDEDDYDTPFPEQTIYREQRGHANTWGLDRVPLICSSRRVGQVPARVAI